jgi:hypothetical protein
MMTIRIKTGLNRPVHTAQYEWTSLEKDGIVHHIAAPVGAGGPDPCHYVALTAGDP